MRFAVTLCAIIGLLAITPAAQGASLQRRDDQQDVFTAISADWTVLHRIKVDPLEDDSSQGIAEGYLCLTQPPSPGVNATLVRKTDSEVDDLCTIRFVQSPVAMSVRIQFPKYGSGTDQFLSLNADGEYFVETHSADDTFNGDWLPLGNTDAFTVRSNSPNAAKSAYLIGAYHPGVQYHKWNPFNPQTATQYTTGDASTQQGIARKALFRLE